MKHYEAGITSDELPYGLERLYDDIAVVELTMACAAHCRHCLRSNYPRFTLKDEDIDGIIKYLANSGVTEVLITGGDPLLAPRKLKSLIEAIDKGVKSVKIIRVATRLFTQDPDRIDIARLTLANTKRSILQKLEIATQINSASELSPKAIRAIESVKNYGIPIYAQNVFLKGVNDSVDELVKLYKALRLLGIEPHYLFHSIPMAGTHHMRSSVKKMVECYEGLCNSGKVTGRAKPILALMTDIGKITLLPGTILGYEDGKVRLTSGYLISERLKNNPEWKLPSNARVNSNGYLEIEYLDGE